MKQKINLRLSLIALIAILATAVGTTLVYYGLFQDRVQAELRQNAELLRDTEVFQTTYSSDKDNADALEHRSYDNLRITWIDRDGTVIFDNDTGTDGLSNHMDRPEIQDAFQTGEGQSTRRSDTLGMNTFYYALLLENGTVLRVSTQARTISGVFAAALPVIVFIVILILIGCVLIGNFLTRLLMRPIDDMAEHLEENNHTPVYKELEPFANKIRIQHENILAAAKSRQDFTASVTHELKTPITAISGYAELIENRMVTGDAEIHIAQEIRHNADRLTSLVTDIIQLSELDHRELPRVFEQIDLFRVASECVDALRPMADSVPVTLTCIGTSAEIHADHALIREMIDNLVQNAIRYNRENGSVLVKVYIENNHPVLLVKDTGIGIPKESCEHVFERFYRVDKSRSRETGGTGLGLAIVKHIADIHSAEIDLNSVLGEGTEILIKF